MPPLEKFDLEYNSGFATKSEYILGTTRNHCLVDISKKVKKNVIKPLFYLRSNFWSGEIPSNHNTDGIILVENQWENVLKWAQA